MATLTEGLQLRDVRAFCAVADHGSFTRAARALGEGKGATSRRVQRLEALLGATLVRRSPRLVQLTESGHAFRQRAGAAIEQLDEAANVVQLETAVPKGKLRLTAPNDLGASFVTPLAMRFQKLYPKVEFEYFLTERRLDFDAHALDFAFRAASTLSDSTLVVAKLFGLPTTTVATPTFLEKARIHTPQDLAKLPICCFHASGSSLSLEFERKAGRGKRSELVRCRPTLIAADGNVVREAALADGGVAIIPKIFVERDLQRGALTEVLGDWSLASPANLYLLHARMEFPPPKIRAFREFILKEAKISLGRTFAPVTPPPARGEKAAPSHKSRRSG